MIKHRKTNILILESIFHLGGIEALIYNIVKRLDKTKYNIILCTLYQPGPMGNIFVKDGHNFYHDLIEKKTDIKAFLKLKRIISENNIDIIYLITQPLTLFWGVLVGKACKIPIMCLIGNTVVISEHIKLNIYRLMMRFVNRVVAQAYMQKEHWIRNVGIPEHLISVVYNGIDVDRFKTSVNRAKKLRTLRIDSSHKIVGIIGRLVDLKGIDIFLHAASIVLREDKEIDFIIVGGGPEMQRLQCLANQLGVDDAVHFLGFRNDLVELMNLFDVAVLSSKTEAMPMVLLEYMACGRAIVATRVGSVPETIADGVTGFLVEPYEPNALAEKIGLLLKNEDIRYTLGENAKKIVEEKFRIDVTARKTQALIDELVSK